MIDKLENIVWLKITYNWKKNSITQPDVSWIDLPKFAATEEHIKEICEEDLGWRIKDPDFVGYKSKIVDRLPNDVIIKLMNEALEESDVWLKRARTFAALLDSD